MSYFNHISAGSEANNRRIAYVEQCFGGSGQVKYFYNFCIWVIIMTKYYSNLLPFVCDILYQGMISS